jgi:magnesium-transporting ATPase (P-type)
LKRITELKATLRISYYSCIQILWFLQVKMFSSVGWELVEATSEPPRVRSPNGDELKIVKRNEFDHARMTMSVVVEDCHGELHVYCKVRLKFLES